MAGLRPKRLSKSRALAERKKLKPGDSVWFTPTLDSPNMGITKNVRMKGEVVHSPLIRAGRKEVMLRLETRNVLNRPVMVRVPMSMVKLIP